jgi:hypothetical protein
VRVRALRHRSVTVAAVVVAGSLAWAGLAGALPAGASTGTSGKPALTIRAIDRGGKIVPVTASLDSLNWVPSGAGNYSLTSAHATRVAKGTYNIAAWVMEPGGNAQTLVDREIKVTSSTTVTFDARKGRKLRFAVNDPSVRTNVLGAEPYATNYGAVAFGGWGGAPANGTYLVPGKLPPGWRVFLEADLTRPNMTVSPLEYQLVRSLSGSIPANLTFTVEKAKLASDHVVVRRIDPGATGAISFQAAAANGTPVPSLMAGQSGAAPFSIEFHFTPGYDWQPCASWANGPCEVEALNNLSPLGVHHYAQTFGNAVFSPSGQLFANVNGTRLQISDNQWLLVDPEFDTDSSGLPTPTQAMWLYHGSKLLQHSISGEINVAIPQATRWYRLHITASRGPGTTLFKSLALNYTFQAHAMTGGLAYGVDAFWPRIIPSGLNRLNAAKQGTKTTVPIWFANLSGNVAVHGVQMWVSANGGKNWSQLRVTGTGAKRTTTVTNPAKAGYVSLRVRATDGVGVTTDVTVINAYAVS